MRKLLLIWLLASAFQIFSQNGYTVLTYNIRFNNPQDGVHAWPNRSHIMMDSLSHLAPDIFGLQEVLYGQYKEIMAGLPGYSSYGIGRDNGKKEGEHAPIFFKNERFNLLQSGTFWLSETPEKPSKGWDANLPRIVSWVKLKDKKQDQVLFVFNTHFDHKGALARKNSGPLVMAKIKEIAGDAPFIFCGDLNLREDHETYALFAATYQDSRLTSKEVLGTHYTFLGFDESTPPADPGRIDYIFCNKGAEVERYDCSDWRRAPGAWLSDHRPVYVRIAHF